MSTLKYWVQAARLRTLPLSISGIIVGTALAAYNGFFDWQVFTLAILTTISLQVLSNFANDYGDGVKGTDNEDRIGPQRALQSGNISSEAMLEVIKKNILICIILSFSLIYSAFGSKHLLYALAFFVIGLSSIYAAIRYTMGNNAYGYRGLGDVFVFLFFGLVSVIGSYVLYSKQIDHVTFLPACVLGFLSAAVLNLNNMRDIESDRKANKNTLVVKLGSSKAKKYHYFLIISAIILSFVFGILYYTSIFNLLFLIAYIPLFIHLKNVKNNTNPVHLDPELKKLALTTFLLAILLAIGHLL
ncbi:1,4-dihydroxy-2-naphthoate octaprenyltransferase [Oceanihabitans sp. 2_MG-2023]|uniref:1,4-dihydroxy-2-naphthoate octaprenyltransferase n=1 Tax=Oceanihabitans sp. 2_MG-2023 TaxID=3062661 RepID=UPI0026E260D8|nr:1,4-dihydroxy-2-naphthoate octaprenyltransferase [Oceanihabitans sp. 2_MG-2023]MDO6597352.1 1,4-dihydroxy-2-naphthoate octaprenyltransferase [Oceanihabitans sp. 2_MG-2023]